MEFQPATAERWDDLETLFRPRGAFGGCWCMYWRLPHAEFNASSAAEHRAALQQLVAAKKAPGILAYASAEEIAAVTGAPAPAGAAVGWCALAPREEYRALARSRILKPVDDQPVWSVTCFFISRPFRRRGLTVQLLEAACAYAAAHGAHIVEGYPVEPAGGRTPDPFVYVGLASAFRKAGFTEVARRSPTRPIMRRIIA